MIKLINFQFILRDWDIKSYDFINPTDSFGQKRLFSSWCSVNIQYRGDVPAQQALGGFSKKTLKSALDVCKLICANRSKAMEGRVYIKMHTINYVLTYFESEAEMQKYFKKCLVLKAYYNVEKVDLGRRLEKLDDQFFKEITPLLEQLILLNVEGRKLRDTSRWVKLTIFSLNTVLMNFRTKREIKAYLSCCVKYAAAKKSGNKRQIESLRRTLFSYHRGVYKKLFRSVFGMHGLNIPSAITDESNLK